MQEQIDAIIADLNDYTRGEIVALALEVDATLRANPPIGTPVDTGWASANWTPSVGEPRFFRVDNIKDPTPGAVQAMEMQAQRGLSTVINWKLEDGAIFNTNNVPYIQPLNDGHSPQQASPGFIQRALDRAVRQSYVASRAKKQRNSRALTARAAKRRPKR